MKVAVIMNCAAGSIGEDQRETREREVRDAFAAAGVEVEIHAVEGGKLTETARAAAASGVDAVVAAGGDGTVSAVAAALAGGTVPMGVLPLGTLNHFARDLGMPDDLVEAAKLIAARRLSHVDVGEVNGRSFINNSSFGLYPEIVVRRDAEQKQHGTGKWRAMANAAFRVLRRFPLLFVRVVMPGRTLSARTPFVFVGNNRYQIEAMTLGQREHLDGGKLSLYLVRCKGRLRMFWLMVRAILQRLDSVRDFEAEEATEAHIGLGRRGRRLRVAMDGEVWPMVSPLHYKIRAGALPVLR
jgi:diacylglycerol kinase family enzyme